MTDVAFVDTTLRDGQQSLWAMAMTTSMILPVTGDLERAGFAAAEIVSTAFPRKLVRELRDDPWERVRRVAARLPGLPLRMIMSRHVAGFQLTPRSLARLCVERAAANGIRQVRVSDPSNTIPLLAERVADLRDVGIEPVINLIYSLSPKHTDAYYGERARQARELRPAAICIKDPGGLLTPERTRTLVPVVLAAADTVPVEFHTHCNTGLGPLCCLEAVRLGIRIVHTAIPPLADGSSNPSVHNVARNLEALGYGVQVDRSRLAPIEAHLTRIAQAERLPVGAPVEYDASYYGHQVPGGMISNLRHQLARLGLASRLPQVLAEVARVRQELGHPIMVTPYSQFVGTQATFNVVTGRRYAEVTDELIQYALGLWGDEERDAIQSAVRQRILDRPRAAQLARWTPPEPTIADIRREHGGPGVSDDDLYLRYLLTTAELARVRPVDPDEYRSDRPLAWLLRQLARRCDLASLHLERPGLSLHWQAADPTPPSVS